MDEQLAIFFLSDLSEKELLSIKTECCVSN